MTYVKPTLAERMIESAKGRMKMAAAELETARIKYDYACQNLNVTKAVIDQFEKEEKRT